MQIDLAAAAAQTANALRGKFRAEFTGGKIEIDELGFLSRIADAIAHAMGANLFKGLTPDGSGTMPGRKEDGKPRGLHSRIARALMSVQQGGRLEWLIAAHREQPGHLARIMREVAFRAPPLAQIVTAIKLAFQRSVKVGVFAKTLRQRGDNFARTLRWGGGKGQFRRPQSLGKLTTRAARSSQIGQFASSLRASQFGKTLRSGTRRGFSAGRTLRRGFGGSR